MSHYGDIQGQLAHPASVTGKVQRRLLDGERLRSKVVMDEYHCTRPLFFSAIKVFERHPGYRLHGRGSKNDTYWVERRETVLLDFSQRKVVAAAYKQLMEERQEDRRRLDELIRELEEVKRRKSEQDQVISWLAQQANGGDPIDAPAA